MEEEVRKIEEMYDSLKAAIKDYLSKIIADNNATEDNPLKCDVDLTFGNYGLVCNMPKVTSLFEDKDTIWIKEDLSEDPIDLDEVYLDDQMNIVCSLGGRNVNITRQCPFCGAEKAVETHEDEYQRYYHCPECDRHFSDEDAEHEILRRKVSAICSAVYATEKHPIDCSRFDMELHIDIHEVSQGLSEVEKPQVLTIFQDTEGIVWITIDFMDEPIELDSILTDSIREILQYLEENLNVGIDENSITHMNRIIFSEYQ